MKTKLIPNDNNIFNPVKIEFEFTTQDELDRFGSMLNHREVAEFLSNYTQCGNYNFLPAFEEGGADIHKYITGGGIEDFFSVTNKGK